MFAQLPMGHGDPPASIVPILLVSIYSLTGSEFLIFFNAQCIQDPWKATSREGSVLSSTDVYLQAHSGTRADPVMAPSFTVNITTGAELTEVKQL